MILAAVFLRPARARPLRFLATLLGVAAGIAALVSTRVSSRAAVDAFARGVVELAGPARIEVLRDGGVPIEVLAALAGVAGDAEILPVVDEIVIAPELEDAVRVLGVDMLARGVLERLFADPVGRADGAPFAAALRCEGAWISRALAARLGKAPGSTLELVVRGSSVRVAVLGLFDAAGERAVFERAVVLDVACAQELLLRPMVLDRIELVPTAGVSEEELRASVAAVLPPGARIGTPERRAEDARSLARTLQFDLDVMALIALFVGGVLVAISLATSVVQRRAVLAICVSLGASRASIARALLVEALAIGLAGGVLGVLLGYATAAVTADGVRATLASVLGSAPARAIELRAIDVLFGAGLGAGSALAAAVLPLLEARRTPPVQSLRRDRPTELTPRARAAALVLMITLVVLAAIATRVEPWDGLPVAALSAAFLLQGALFFALPPVFDLVGRLGARASAHSRSGAIFRLALSALAAGRRRAVWAAGAVGIAVSLSIAITTMVDSFRATLTGWTVRALTADFWIRPPSVQGGIVGTLAPRHVDLARELFGAEHVDPSHSTTARVAGVATTLRGAQFEVVKERGMLTFVDGTDPRSVFDRAHGTRAVLVNEAFALRFEKGTGDSIEIEVAERVLVKEIAGVLRDYGDSQGQVFLDGEEFRALLPDSAPREVALFLPPGTDLGAARARYLAALAPEERVELVSVAELRARVFEVFERTFAVTRGIELVAACVAVVAVLTVLYALLSERRVELGILRALGASPTEVGATIAAQAGLLGGIGALTGAATGLAIGWVVVVVVHLQSFRWTLEYHVPWAALGETIVGVTVVCALAGLLPAASALAWSPRELLTEDE